MVSGETAPLQSRWLSMRHRLLDPGFWADRAIVIAMVALLIAGWLLSPQFLTADNLESITVAGAILTVLAVGQTFVVLTAGIDLSLGSVTMLTSVMIGLAVTQRFGVGVGCLMAIC